MCEISLIVVFNMVRWLIKALSEEQLAVCAALFLLIAYTFWIRVISICGFFIGTL